MRLDPFTLATFAPADAETCGYDRAAQAVGIVHFGIGAFHRAHQAWYTDRAMAAGDRDWSIIGVSLRSAEVAHQMNPQEGLYTVTERSGEGAHTRVVGAVRQVLVAPYEPEEVVAALAAPGTRIASFTITEKGYCRAADGSLDPALAGEDSVYRFLADGLRRRRDAGLGGLTLMSCDNLADNGRQLARLMGQYLQARDPALLPWFEAECSCPSTMVDRIVPATTADDREQVAEALDGLRDEAAVMTEPFSQWVIEDRFVAGRPRWESVGAELVSDVRPYETAKLRMLNGAHSMLAYVGLAHGHTYVHEAVADPQIGKLAEALMREEAAPTIVAAPGQDLGAYANALLARFANPALNHRLIQIAMDGSQKIPQRWLETLAANQQQGRECPAILAGIAAWIRHLRGANGPVDDPLAARLAEAAAGPDAVDALFGPAGVLASAWQPDAPARSRIAGHLAA
ncbi:mannitol dehydrogenase [Novosphingobium sp. TH158]|nr:mannitol dehydrogenase family protein [Novosphingobium sp. TH158]PLK27947.1 mannitol dehydrogenase [Novosphingobium sp. TH158]